MLHVSYSHFMITIFAFILNLYALLQRINCNDNVLIMTVN